MDPAALILEACRHGGLKCLEGALQELGKYGLVGATHLAAVGVKPFLLAGTSWAGPFIGSHVRQMPWTTKLSTRQPQDVGVVRERIRRSRTAGRPTTFRVRGTFFPCLLLCSGWWERRRRTVPPVLRTNVQSWLMHGFEQWAPSWDFSLPTSELASRYLFAQIGEGDEADSIAVVVCGEEKVQQVQQFVADRMVFEAEVTGQLTHRRYLVDEDGLDEEFRGVLETWGDAFSYCLLVKEDEPEHKVEPLRSRDPSSMVYSGYLWQCLAPKEWIRERHGLRSFEEWNRQDQPLTLNEIYFVWEHTNFAKPDAVAYNLDSLAHKRAYLEKRHGELVLIQQSSPLAVLDPAEQPAYEKSGFYEWMATRFGNEAEQ